MKYRLTTLIVDDHPVFRQGLRVIIGADPRFEVVAEADNGTKGLNLVRQYRPQLLLLDINLPDMNGLELVRRLKAARSTAKVIILTAFKEEALFNQAMNLDVRGYLLKDNAVQGIVECMKTVAGGKYYLTPSMSACLLRRSQRARNLEDSQPAMKDLTTAERRILRSIGANRTSRQIAREFGVSHRTVEAHRAHICSKLNLRGSHRLLQFAIEHQSEL